MKYEDPTPDFEEGIFIIDKTSCIKQCRQEYTLDNFDQIKSESNENIKIVIFDKRSLYLFDHKSKFRKFIVKVTQSNIFDSFIVLAIFLNSLILAITDYSDRSNE